MTLADRIGALVPKSATLSELQGWNAAIDAAVKVAEQYCANDQVRSIETEGLDPQGAERGPQDAPKEAAASPPAQTGDQ